MNQTLKQDQYLDKTKVSTPLMWPLEQKWIGFILPKIPSYLNTVNLTVISILWSGLIILCGWLGRQEINWLWVITGLMVIQYITDCLDGAVGRYRKNGLIKWGHYMDHFLDYIFMCAVIISYQLLLPEHTRWLVVLLCLIGSFMVSTYIIYGLTDKFHIGYGKVGMTEFRIGVVIMNVMIILVGPAFLSWLLPVICLAFFLLLVQGVYKSQKIVWLIDQENKIKNSQINKE